MCGLVFPLILWFKIFSFQKTFQETYLVMTSLAKTVLQFCCQISTLRVQNSFVLNWAKLEPPSDRSFSTCRKRLFPPRYLCFLRTTTAVMPCATRFRLLLGIFEKTQQKLSTRKRPLSLIQHGKHCFLRWASHHNCQAKSAALCDQNTFYTPKWWKLFCLKGNTYVRKKCPSHKTEATIHFFPLQI